MTKLMAAADDAAAVFVCGLGFLLLLDLIDLIA
jgi:hypothetical protein